MLAKRAWQLFKMNLDIVSSANDAFPGRFMSFLRCNSMSGLNAEDFITN